MQTYKQLITVHKYIILHALMYFVKCPFVKFKYHLQNAMMQWTRRHENIRV